MDIYLSILGPILIFIGLFIIVYEMSANGISSLFSGRKKNLKETFIRGLAGVYNDTKSGYNPYRAPWAEDEGPKKPAPPMSVPSKPKKKPWSFNMNWWKYDVAETLWGIVGFGFIFTVLGAGGWAGYSAIKSDGHADYCYIQWKQNGQGHRAR